MGGAAKPTMDRWAARARPLTICINDLNEAKRLNIWN